ncbi:MAG: hypothetical protein LAO51_15285 [Acidobacteriia bacterium]|nr:hypothetical protein [Terriglobia bacterium]
MTRTRTALFLGALMLALLPAFAMAQEKPPADPPTGPVYVSEPVVPIITPAVKDLPDWKPDPNLFGLEMKRRDDFGFIPVLYPIKPQVDPLLQLEQLEGPKLPDAFGTPVHNYAGQTSSASPPDCNGDVGPTYFVQSVNQSVSTVEVLNKSTGANAKIFTLQSLATASPCSSGFCDPVVNYDRMADRWLITELPSSGGSVCVYVSTSGDPTGTYYAYTFAVESGLTDYPKYGVWPQNGNAGSYIMGANAGSTGHDLFAFDRAKMLAGLPATFQKFTVTDLPNSGFQLVLPGTVQGNTPPPNGEPAIFARPRDDEAQDGASTPTYDFMELWALSIDWATPANSTLTQLTSLHMGDYDMTLCGMGSIWNCMPQPGTTQKIDPIREPLHHPFQYRNFGDHQSLVGTFVEDVDGTDHSALRWFELRKVGAGAWSLFQEGVVGGESGVHRSVGSIAMDGSGNIAIGYTRTGGSAPYYPSIYYKGRLSTDTPGTMPQGEYVIQDATTSKTNNERWGDYAGIGVDPTDDCTFWFTTEYGGSGATRVAAMKFDACGCLSVPAAPTTSASVPQDNRIDVSWDDSATSSITQYLVYRSTTTGGPYTQIATVPDSSPGVGLGPSYTYHDDTVSGGTRYYYVVKSTDGVSCYSVSSNEVNALATGRCLLAPTFAGLAAVANPGNNTCTLNLSWSAGTSVCSGTLAYNVYRSTTSGFTPAPANQIATGVMATSYADAVGIVYNTAYYYVVRAVDLSNAVEDANTVQKSGVPTGPVTTSSWTDTFEGSLSGGGFDLAGWTHSAVSGSTNWTWSTAQKHDGTHSWFAQDIGAVSDKVLTSPSFGVGASTTLTFWHTYAFEGSVSSCYDGATLEYSTNGTTWTVVPATDFTAGGYTGTVNSSYSNPLAGKRAWCAGTVGTLTQVTVNLGGDASLLAKTIQLRWHEGDDSSVTATGWYVDTVTVNNAQVGGSCTTGTGCTAPGAPSLVGAAGDCAAANLMWSAGTGSTSSYNVYRGTASGGPYTKLAGMPVTGTAYADTTAVAGTTYVYVVTGACDAGGVTQSAYSNEISASRLASGAACDDGNACTRTDTCQAGACAGGNPVVCTPLDQCHDVGVCDTGTGVCSNPAKLNGAACNDGNACTQTDTCQAGACVAGSPVVCTALDQCHDAGVCDTGTGLCSNPAKQEGAACNDGDLCTQTDTCQAGACIGSNPVVCTPLDQCHDAGVCDTGTGACSIPAKQDGTACEDGNACTAGDTCQTGVCVSGAPVPGPGVTGGLAFGNVNDLSWTAPIGATGYDVVRGTLSMLIGSGFTPATDICLGNHITDPFISDTHVPAEGDADWFLIRAYDPCGTGTFDDGEPSQNGSRDAAIAASQNACP